MPRPLRIEYEGAIYHVMYRGDLREPVFRDDVDRKRFLETLGEACAKTDWQVHALCLMGNHFHLVVVNGSVNSIVLYFCRCAGVDSCRSQSFHDLLPRLSGAPPSSRRRCSR